ncbi:hypothetical protein BCD67_14050 [Oscillatoriales cyanobacterium USR001]|nr:hypothetical protein BCD67_14050 [Oscillatoriales cyanobacterium USR001]
MPAMQPSIAHRQRESGDRRFQNRRKRSKHNNPHQAIAIESVAKLTANLVLSLFAASALVQLLPYHRSVQAKLQEIQGEVKLTQGRVDRAKAEFNRNFDPTQANTIMQEQSNRIAPNQRPVVWIENEN